MKPEDVHSSNFTHHEVLFDKYGFSIAIGNWEDNPECPAIGMRWNESPDGRGYPKVFGHPQWFIVENEIAILLLSSLLGKVKNENRQKILKAIQDIL